MIINNNYTAFVLANSIFLCPSDPNQTGGGAGENSYRYNFGGSTPYAGAESNSLQGNVGGVAGGNGAAFTIGPGIGLAEITDGSTNTAAFSDAPGSSPFTAPTQLPSPSDTVTMPTGPPASSASISSTTTA